MLFYGRSSKVLCGVKKLVFFIISTSLLVIAVLIAVMVIVWKKRKTMVEEKPEYKGLIALGLIFLPWELYSQ